MPKYIIERSIPGAGELSAGEFQQIAQKSCCVLNEMGPQIQWLESFYKKRFAREMDDFRKYPNVRTHAERGGFPANSIAEVKTIIDPTTGE